MLVAGLLVSGALAQARWNAYGMARAWVLAARIERTVGPAESFVPTRDPGLLDAIVAARPEPARPDLRDAAALRTWQGALRERLLELFELQDVSEPHEVRFTIRERELPDERIRRLFLTIEAHDGTEVPAYLFEPVEQRPPGPAVIVLHGHVGAYEEGITQSAGLVQSYHRRAALELARAGYVTLALELRGFGYLGAQAGFEHVFIAHNALLSGSFYKAVVVRDVNYAFELLRTRPSVDPERIGITGVSLGGEVAATYAVLDERVRAIALHGYGGAVGPVRGVSGRSRITQPHNCHLVPGHNRYLHQEDWILLLAPRPSVVIRGDREGIPDERFEARVREAYRSLGDESDFAFKREPGGHAFFPDAAIAFFKSAL